MTGFRKHPALAIIIVTFVRKLDENTIDIARADYAGSQPPLHIHCILNDLRSVSLLSPLENTGESCGLL